MRSALDLLESSKPSALYTPPENPPVNSARQAGSLLASPPVVGAASAPSVVLRRDSSENRARFLTLTRVPYSMHCVFANNLFGTAGTRTLEL